MSSTDPPKKKKEEDPSPSSLVQEVRNTLRTGIRQTVRSTNAALANLQSGVHSVSQPVAKSLRTAEHEGSAALGRAVRLYDRRREYGIELVAGTAVLFAGWFALRRGRYSGAFAGLLSGSLAYAAIYDPFSMQDVQDALNNKPESGKK